MINMKTFIVFNCLIVAIIVLRSLLEGKISKRLQYAMWLLLPAFLIISSIISIPITVKVSYKAEKALNYAISDYSDDTAFNANAISEKTNNTITVNNAPEGINEHSNVTSRYFEDDTFTSTQLKKQSMELFNTKNVITLVYISGVIIISLIIAFNNLKFVIKTKLSRRYYCQFPQKNLSVYKLEDILSPFLLGKSIYIPVTMNTEDEAYKFATNHEYCHYIQGDSFWPILEYMMLILFWFDPLVWVAHVLVLRDSELAVDERVIDLLGKEERKRYSQTLLSFLVNINKDRNILTVSTSMNGKSTSFIKCRVTSIMKGSKKSIAATLAASIFIAGVIGCSALNPTPKSEAKYITENTTWWNNTSVEFPINQVTSGHMELANNVIYSNEDFYIQSFVDVSPDRACKSLCKYSYDGSSFQKIDLIANFGNDIANNLWSEYYYAQNDKEYFMFYRYNPTIENIDYVTYEIDWKNGLLSGETVLDRSNMPSGSIMTVLSTKDTIDYLILDDSTTNSDNLKYYLYSANGTNHNVEEFSYSKKDASICVMGNSVVGSVYCLLLDVYDPSSNQASKVIIRNNLSTGEYEEFEITDGYCLLVNNEVYKMATNGISKYSWNNGDFEDFIYYEDTYINYEYDSSNNYSVLWSSDERVVLTVEQGGIYVQNGTDMIVTLTKANENPHLGKALLSLAHMDLLPSTIYKSVNKFNRENGDVFINITDEYYIIPDLPDEWVESDYISASNSVMNKMLVDINGGDGPDLIILDSNTAQLNDSRYLTKLNNYLKNDDDLREVEYVADIFQYANSDMYKLPFAINFNAIVAKHQYCDEFASTLTYADYEEFINSNSLGEIYSGDKLAMFNELFVSSSNQFFNKDNTISINNEAFKKMTEFVKNRPDVSSYYGYEVLPDVTKNTNYTTWIYQIGGMYSDYDFMAYPSTNSQGITAFTTGIGIAACSPLEDEAWQFCKSLLSTDVQSSGFEGAMPINREAFYNYSQTIIDECNTFLPEYQVIGTLDSNMAEYYLKCLGEVSIQRDVDSGILEIMDEELQAYFANQKSIDEVIVIIESRVNTLIDERG